MIGYCHCYPSNVQCVAWLILHYLLHVKKFSHITVIGHISKLVFFLSYKWSSPTHWEITWISGDRKFSLFHISRYIYLTCLWPPWTRRRLARWRHQIETFSASLAICAGNSPVPGEFPTQRPVTRSFDVFIDLRPNKRLSKEWWGWWLETPSCPL